MCVEVVKSIALKPTRSSSGAAVSVFAVSMPSALQRLWLPSRSEVSTSATSAIAFPAHDAQQHLSGLDRGAVLRQDLDDPAAHLGAHPVHELLHLVYADTATTHDLGVSLHEPLPATSSTTFSIRHFW